MNSSPVGLFGIHGKQQVQLALGGQAVFVTLAVGQHRIGSRHSGVLQLRIGEIGIGRAVVRRNGQLVEERIDLFRPQIHTLGVERGEHIDLERSVAACLIGLRHLFGRSLHQTQRSGTGFQARRYQLHYLCIVACIARIRFVRFSRCPQKRIDSQSGNLLTVRLFISRSGDMIDKLVLGIGIAVSGIAPVRFVGHFADGQQRVRLQGLDTDLQLAVRSVSAVFVLIAVGRALRRTFETDGIDDRIGRLVGPGGHSRSRIFEPRLALAAVRLLAAEQLFGQGLGDLRSPVHRFVETDMVRFVGEKQIHFVLGRHAVIGSVGLVVVDGRRPLLVPGDIGRGVVRVGSREGDRSLRLVYRLYVGSGEMVDGQFGIHLSLERDVIDVERLLVRPVHHLDAEFGFDLPAHRDTVEVVAFESQRRQPLGVVPVEELDRMGVGLVEVGVLDVERRHGRLAAAAQVLVAVDLRFVFGRHVEAAHEVQIRVLLVLDRSGFRKHGVGREKPAFHGAVAEGHLRDGQSFGLVQQVDAHRKTAQRHLAAVGHLAAVRNDLQHLGGGHDEGVVGVGGLLHEQFLQLGHGRSGTEGLDGALQRRIGIGHQIEVEAAVLGDVERAAVVRNRHVEGPVEAHPARRLFFIGRGEERGYFLLGIGSGRGVGFRRSVVACGAGSAVLLLRRDAGQREDHAVAVARSAALGHILARTAAQQYSGHQRKGRYDSCFHCVISFFSVCCYAG